MHQCRLKKWGLRVLLLWLLVGLSAKAQQITPEMAVTPGGIYNYSDTYNASATTFFSARFRLQSGVVEYVDLGSSTPSAYNWFASVNFRAPVNAVSVSVFRMLQGTGSLAVVNPSLKPVSQWGFAQGIVSINFDDGLRSTYGNAIPILDAAHMKSTNYIITGRFNFPDYVGTPEVLSLQARGHEIGAHSRTHVDLTQLGATQLQNEVKGSRSDLFSIGVQSVQTFAYPFGAYNDATMQAAKNAGFVAARSTNTGQNWWDINRFVLQRQNLGEPVTLSQVQGWIDGAVASKTWLILLAHHVDYTHSAYSITPELLQQIVNYLLQRKVAVVTMSQGLQMMQP